MYIRKHDQIYDIHPSLCLDQWSNEVFMRKILDICIRKRLSLHVWFHLWNFGQKQGVIQKSIDGIFLPFLKYARKKVDEGELSFETIVSSINGLTARRAKHE